VTIAGATKTAQYELRDYYRSGTLECWTQQEPVSSVLYKHAKAKTKSNRIYHDITVM